MVLLVVCLTRKVLVYEWRLGDSRGVGIRQGQALTSLVGVDLVMKNDLRNLVEATFISIFHVLNQIPENSAVATPLLKLLQRTWFVGKRKDPSGLGCL